MGYLERFHVNIFRPLITNAMENCTFALDVTHDYIAWADVFILSNQEQGYVLIVSIGLA